VRTNFEVSDTTNWSLVRSAGHDHKLLLSARIPNNEKASGRGMAAGLHVNSITNQRQCPPNLDIKLLW
jgi:hypothetical protein